ncbi:hypothetical protein MgSA37_03675 [Mucilaginibacter gotjawali]|uniref:Uncharacterized protein n=2 Tax=Mucilaginibacter gotjawali TaxID=1550579 RepID=A0A0X8X4I7_9SPHI|nr:hypothetical protein [Mucilaginibacter gotjawali]BAU55486.1 hypothetical protein MgSA37_03675 [Mucilaginibacter gotjawali]
MIDRILNRRLFINPIILKIQRILVKNEKNEKSSINFIGVVYGDTIM